MSRLLSNLFKDLLPNKNNEISVSEPTKKNESTVSELTKEKESPASELASKDLDILFEFAGVDKEKFVKDINNAAQAEKLYYQGYDYAEEGQYLKAIECYRQSLEIQKESHALFNLAGILFQRMEYAEAERLVTEAIEIAKNEGTDNTEYIPFLKKIEAYSSNYYRDNGSQRKAFLEDLKEKGYEYVAQRLIDVTFEKNSKFVEYYFFNELEMINMYEDLSNFSEIHFLLNKYSKEEIAAIVEPSIHKDDYSSAEYAIKVTEIENFLKEYEKKFFSIRFLLGTYDLPIIRKMRCQILKNIYDIYIKGSSINI